MPKGKALTEAEKAKREKEKVAKFKEIGSKRTNNAIQAINRLVPLGNTTQYSYTAEQVGVIKKALRDAVDRVENAFTGKSVDIGGIAL